MSTWAEALQSVFSKGIDAAVAIKTAQVQANGTDIAVQGSTGTASAGQPASTSVVSGVSNGTLLIGGAVVVGLLLVLALRR